MAVAPLTLERDISRAVELLENLQKSGEVDTTKVEALKKVLQSDFLRAVRDVYEHMYETVDVEGSPEVRASATAKATVAAFAASEGESRKELAREFEFGKMTKVREILRGIKTVANKDGD